MSSTSSTHTVEILLKTLIDRQDKTNDHLALMSKQAKTTSDHFDKLGRTGRLATTALAAGVRVIVGEMKQLVSLTTQLMKGTDTFVKFASTSMNAAQGMKNLRDAYSKLVDTSKASVISLKDAASVMAEFQGKGILAKISAASPVLTEAMVSLKKQLRESVGGEQGDSAFSALMGEIPEDKLSAFTNIMSSMTVGTKEWADSLERIGMANSVQTVMTSLEMAKQSQDSLIQSAVTWERLQSQLNSMWDTAKQKILEAFGPNLQKAMEWVANDGISHIIQLVQDLIAYVQSFMPTIETFAKVLGGAFKIAASPMGVFILGLTRIYKLMSGLTGLKMTGLLGGPATVGLAAAGVAAHQFYQWGTKGAGATIGGQVMDQWYDVEGTNKSLNNDTDHNRMGGQQKLAAKYHITLEKLLDIQKKISGTGGNISDYLKNEALAVTKAKKAGDEHNNTVLTAIQLYEKAKGEASKYSGGIQGLTSSLSTLQNLIKGFGPNSGFGKLLGIEQGRSLADFAEQQSKVTEMIRAAKNLLDTGKNSSDKIQAQAQMSEALSKQAELMGVIEQFSSSIGVQDSVRLELQSKMTDISKQNLEISRNLYGTPGLAVTAMQEVVAGLEKQKQLNISILRDVQSAISYAEQQGIDSENLIQLKKKELELQSSIRQQTAEQLSMVKELRDGYLQAVTAQASAAGKFSKIIITQEENVGKAMELHAVRQSFLLGQSGEAAGYGKASSARFKTTGYGLTGGVNNVGNIADPAIRNSVRQTLNLVRGVSGVVGISDLAARNTAGIVNFAASSGANKSVVEGEMARSGKPVNFTPINTNGGCEAAAKSFSTFLQQIGRMLDDMSRNPSAPMSSKPGRFASTNIPY